MVNDPASLWEAQHPGEKPSSQQRSAFTKRRKELFNLIEELVLWENTTNEAVLERARAEIRRSWKEVCALNASDPGTLDREVRALLEAKAEHPEARAQLILLDPLPANASVPAPIELIPAIPWFLAPEGGEKG